MMDAHLFVEVAFIVSLLLIVASAVWSVWH